ncbi:brca1-associated protein-like protein [Dinothrombium tinctorium]|uniref:Brca1-associated protein-like protein n=1 Tax=Dinothrombium tinctorium TaxID=1965070 RepID=A0A3S3SKF0_9ACAR|nr:brca1-associated protein-like protein [Dinothrombium tinctorium]
MSISFIVLRFEIDNAYDLIPNIHYTAPKFLKSMESGGAAKNDSLSTSTKPETVKTGEDAEKLVKKHRGSREMQEITIETVKLNEEQSKTSKVSFSGKSVSRQVSKSSKESTPDSIGGGNASLKSGLKERMLPSKGIPNLNQLQFYSGNHFVEVTKGILHLYKENKLTTLSEEAERSELICLLCVPTSMTTHDLIQFTAPMSQDIEHLRIIRDNKPNQYMVLIKFRNQKSADEFYNNFNGVAFNSIEPEVCHLVYVAKVETVKESENACLPITGHTELPTCPVCLERMDESVEGILTILCNHSFHSSCLSKWGDTSCPVCRYCQTPEPVPDNRCFECGSQQDSLWICLVCGHIGCGRYVEGHAYNHYCETQHTYAMQLGMNNRVWDYAGDNYVHRLLQNKSDGKPVEVECDNQRINDEKIDAVQLEYTYLLTNQLESQRHYYEETIARIEKEAREQIEDIIDKSKIVSEEKEKLESKYSAIAKEKQAMEKKLNQLATKLNKVVAELEEEKEINKCLRENQSLWNQKLQESETQLKLLVEKKDKEVKDLQEQVRDLMFYLEAQQKLKDVSNVSREEIESGHIVVSPSASSSNSRTRNKNKKR